MDKWQSREKKKIIIGNQSTAIPILRKHFLAKRPEMRYNNINKSAFELYEE